VKIREQSAFFCSPWSFGGLVFWCSSWRKQFQWPAKPVSLTWNPLVKAPFYACNNANGNAIALLRSLLPADRCVTIYDHCTFLHITFFLLRNLENIGIETRKHLCFWRLSFPKHIHRIITANQMHLMKNKLLSGQNSEFCWPLPLVSHVFFFTEKTSLRLLVSLSPLSSVHDIDYWCYLPW